RSKGTYIAFIDPLESMQHLKLLESQSSLSVDISDLLFKRLFRKASWFLFVSSAAIPQIKLQWGSSCWRFIFFLGLKKIISDVLFLSYFPRYSIKSMPELRISDLKSEDSMALQIFWKLISPPVGRGSSNGFFWLCSVSIGLLGRLPLGFLAFCGLLFFPSWIWALIAICRWMLSSYLIRTLYFYEGILLDIHLLHPSQLPVAFCIGFLCNRLHFAGYSSSIRFDEGEYMAESLEVFTVVQRFFLIFVLRLVNCLAMGLADQALDQLALSVYIIIISAVFSVDQSNQSLIRLQAFQLSLYDQNFYRDQSTRPYLISFAFSLNAFSSILSAYYGSQLMLPAHPFRLQLGVSNLST
ncbi:unnamed protein product, partial [Ilex paraguariensis]